MNGLWKRTVGILLTLCLLAGMIPAVCLTASAGVVNVDNMDDFKKLMEKDGDVSIRITKDMKATVEREGDELNGYRAVPYYITVGKGTKTVDLNGCSVKASLKNYHESSTMFRINTGSAVIINDSSGNDSGEIFYDGYIPGYRDSYWIVSMDDACNQNRDLFEVDGGTLTVNSGTLTAGRMKAELSCGTEYNKVLNGTAVELNSGKVVINGGVLVARGMHYIPFFPKYASSELDDALAQGKLKARWHNYLDRNAVVEAHSGTLIVNDGTFLAKSSSDAFQIDDPFYDDDDRVTDATIKKASMTFHRNGCDANFGHDFSAEEHLTYHESSYGEPGIPERAIDRDSLDIELDLWLPYLLEGINDGIDPISHWDDLFKDKGDINLTLTPKLTGSMDVYAVDETGEAKIDNGVCYNGSAEGRSVRVPVKTYWDDEFIWKDDGNAGHLSRLRAYVYRGTPGSVAQVTMGGVTVVKGSFLPDQKADLFRSYEIKRPDVNKNFMIPLSDLIPDSFEKGGKITVYLIQQDIFFSEQGKPRSSKYYNNIFSVEYKDNPVKITAQPTNLNCARGATATFTATASGNPGDAWWEEVSPVKGRRYDATSFSKGTATLSLQAEKALTVCACFNSKYGVVRSNPATLSVPPAEASGVKYVTIYTGQLSAAITSDSSVADTGYRTISWQKAKKVTGTGMTYYRFDNTYLMSTDHIRPGPYLVINKPVEKDAGRYRMEVTYPDGTVWHSEPIDVTVVSGSPPNYIENVEIFGLGDLYTGEVPATVGELWSNDDRYEIQSITWGGLSKGSTGVLTSNSYFQIKLQGRSVNGSGYPYYWFRFNESGNLPFTVHGNNRTVTSYCVNPSSSELNRVVTLSFYFDNHTYLYAANDSVTLERSSFDVMTGEDVNITLNPSLICPDKHEKKHTINGMYIAYGTLPAGLSMDQNGHITGTLTEAPSDKAKVVTLKFYGNLYNDCYANLTFNVHEPANAGGYIDPASLKEFYHVHTWGEWAGDDEYEHSHSCTACGYEEFCPHRWGDDCEVLQKATKTTDGKLRYTCTDCGARMTVSYSYEQESAKIPMGDADLDGSVTVIDATAIQRYLADLPNKTFYAPAADVDGDSSVTVIDATGIQRYLADLSHPAGIGAYA